MKCYLDYRNYDLLKIGDNCTISYGVYFACHGKDTETGKIIIGNNTYIGMRAGIICRNRETKLTGVHIGSDAKIGAHALVNRDVPDGATAVGVPCRIVEEGKGSNMSRQQEV